MTRITTVFAIFMLAAAPAPAFAADDGFTLGEYRAMVDGRDASLDRVLVAMYQTAVYAQASIEYSEICFTPLPLPAAELRTMIGFELGRPDNRLGRAYVDTDYVGLILVNALQSEDVCR